MKSRRVSRKTERDAAALHKKAVMEKAISQAE